MAVLTTVTANISGKTRKETFNGRSYLVAPLTMLVPGVLEGSAGKLFYPPELVANKDPDDWNGMPIVGYHPIVDGIHVSARDPNILEQQGMGFVYRAKTGEKLIAEGWFDEELVKKFDQGIADNAKIWPRLDKQEPIELSTGLIDAVAYPAEPNAKYNDAAYDFQVNSYRPDHLAVLPDQQGACGIKHGCGVLANEESGWRSKVNAFLASLTTFLGTPLFPNLVANRDALSHSDLRRVLSDLLTGRFGEESSPGVDNGWSPSSYTYVADVFDKEVVYEKDGKLYRIGYTTDLRTGSVNLDNGFPVQVRRSTTYKAMNALERPKQDSVALTNGYEDETPPADFGEVIMNREGRINWLIANCDCWKGAGDRDILNKMSDDKLALLHGAAERAAADTVVANAAKQGVDTGSGRLVFNAAAGKWETVAATAPVTPAPTPVPVVNAQPAATAPIAKPLTDAEWLATAPSGIQSAVRNAMETENREKSALVARLVANVTDEAARKAHTDRLSEKPLSELRQLAELLPPVQNMPWGPPPMQSYDGQAAPAILGNAKEDQDDILYPTSFHNEEAA